jgi:D-alanine transaminase
MHGQCAVNERGVPNAWAIRDFPDNERMPITLPPTPCFLNGDYLPISEAKVSVLDRGFIFGDGIYEVVPVYGGRPFRFEQHMQRLERSLAELRLPNPFDRAGWLSLITTLSQQLAAQLGTPVSELEQTCYLQITRGVALRDHVMPENIAPTVFAMTNVMHAVSAAVRARGVACVSADDFRWQKAHIKSTSLLGAVLSRQISADVDAFETVMFRDGMLSEAAASNVWVVKDGWLTGPPANQLVLEGIRYGLLETLCEQIGMPFELRPLTRAEVLDADELLLSSATKEVLSITTLDDRPVGHGAMAGRPGPAYERLYAAYQGAKRQSAQSSTAATA